MSIEDIKKQARDKVKEKRDKAYIDYFESMYEAVKRSEEHVAKLMEEIKTWENKYESDSTELPYNPDRHGR